jgi:hypothetical protein
MKLVVDVLFRRVWTLVWPEESLQHLQRKTLVLTLKCPKVVKTELTHEQTGVSRDLSKKSMNAYGNPC